MGFALPLVGRFIRWAAPSFKERHVNGFIDSEGQSPETSGGVCPEGQSPSSQQAAEPKQRARKECAVFQ